MHKKNKTKPTHLENIIKGCYKQSQQSLNLYYYSNDWMEVLKSKDWSYLNKLILNDCKINQMEKIQGLLLLKLMGLSYLSLSFNRTGDICMKLILEKFVKQLKHLQLHDCALTWKSMVQFLQPKILRIQTLNLSLNNIGSKGIALLIKSNMPNLTTLNLSICHIGDTGAKNLIKGNWPKLSSLELIEQFFTIDGYKTLPLLQTKNIKTIPLNQKNILCVMELVRLQGSSILIKNQKYPKNLDEIRKILSNRFGEQYIPKVNIPRLKF